MLCDMVYLSYYYREKVSDRTVLIEASHGQTFEGNMFYVLKEIRKSYKGYKIYLTVTRQSKRQIKAVLKKYGFEDVILTTINTPQYFKALTSAKYLFNDTTFLSSFIKKDQQVYVNTWHGAPLKSLGYDIATESRHTLGNVKRNLILSDYILCPSKEMREKLISAYALENLFKGSIINAGYPRNAVFFDREQEQATRRELGLEGKNIIVYMPTWREFNSLEERENYLRKLNNDLSYLDATLTDNDVFFVKMHVLAQEAIDFSTFSHAQAFPPTFEPYEVLNTADTLITDYSSVFFDFANTGKKVILFVPDLDAYEKRRGFYYSLDELPFPKVEEVESLVEELRQGKNYDDLAFREKFCEFDRASATSDLLRSVLLQESSEGIEVSQLEGNARPNTLMYVSTLPFNGLTSSALSLLSVIERDDENIFFAFRANRMYEFPSRLSKLPAGSKVFPLVGRFRYSLFEVFAWLLFFKLQINTNHVQKYLERLFAREAQRFFGGAHFDRVVHFTGYEQNITGLLQRTGTDATQRVVFVHSNMLEEINTRKNQHYLTLKSAYNNYDKVAVVSEAMRTPTKEISGRCDNIVVVNNALNYKKIHEMAAGDVSFDQSSLSTVSEDSLKEILDSSCVKFISVGRFSPEKGYERLVNAYERFYQEHDNSYLILIGGRGDYESILQHTSKLSCKERVIVVKGLSNPFAVVKSCDLFILPSLYEAFSMALWEASIVGIPAVSVDIPGVREFMLENNGFLVENSEDGLLAGMESFMAGKVEAMKFDVESHNKKVKQQYENLFK